MTHLLNLADWTSSNIHYKISSFPDGQQDTTLLEWWSPDRDEVVRIVSRLNNFKDLELILCATAALRNLRVKNIELRVPYLLGARGDRLFQVGGTFYLRDVIAPILNKQKYEKVIVEDVHSNVAAACIDNLVNWYSGSLLGFALGHISSNGCCFIAPDAGASKKVVDLIAHTNPSKSVLVCSKSRDVNGKLSKTVVPLQGIDPTIDLIIIDDICDGGRTFINIAKEAKAQGHTGRMFLVVTHGIFSAGFEELGKYFTQIFCTNSYSDVKNNLVKQLKII